MRLEDTDEPGVERDARPAGPVLGSESRTLPPTDSRVRRRVLEIVATPELVGGRDGSWSAGSGTTDGQA